MALGTVRMRACGVRAITRLALALVPLLLAPSLRAEELPCRDDSRLSEAAANLLLSGEALSPSRLVEAVRAERYDGVSIRAKESEDDLTIRMWLAALKAEDAGELECGESRSEGRRLFVTGRRLGRLTLEGRKVLGTAATSFAQPRLIIEAQDGELITLGASAAELEKGILLPQGVTPRRVQLMADSKEGPRPVAELSFAKAVARTTEPRGARPPLTRAALTSRVQSFRRSVSLPVLRENRLLVASASAHATRICELGKIVHRLEGEDPEDRLRREHVIARAVGEALARAESFDRAWSALLESPGHRLALTRRDFTDVGVGQASDRKGQVCLVVLLAAWPRRAP